MKKNHFLLIVVSFFVMAATAQSKDEASVRRVLTQQTNDWNKGDIASFMNSYWKSDSLMFVGKSTITYGWKNTLENYIKNYPDTATMGKLTFKLLQVKPVTVNYFFVVGNWHLTRSIGNIGGIFSLLFKKINNRWVIVADHSS